MFEHDGVLRAPRSGATVDRFDVEVAAGDRLVVTVSSRVFDPTLRVTPPGSDVALANDDWEGSKEHAQLVFIVARDGVMNIEVGSDDAEGRGRYRLLVRRSEEATLGGVDVVRVGDEYRGRLESSSPRTPDQRWFAPLWVQVGTPPAAMIVRGEGDFVPEVLLTDPAGQVSTPAHRSSSPLATSGLYAVQVVAPQPETGGSFVVEVASGQTTTLPAPARAHHRAPTAAAPMLDLPVNSPFTGRLETEDSRLDSGETADVFRLELTTNAPVEFELTSTAFDPYLMVVSSEGRLWENDDAGVGTGAMLKIDSMEPGTYRVVATSYQVGELGPYEMKAHVGAHEIQEGAVSEGETGRAIRQPEVGGTLVAGDARLNSGEFADYWSLPLAAGASVQLRLTSSDFDSYLMLRTPSGEQLDNDDLAPGVTDSGLDIPVAQAGEYTVIVTSYRPGGDRCLPTAKA